MRISRGLLVAATSLLICVGARADYSAVGDFSISSNPNGQWSYLYNSTYSYNGSNAILLANALDSSQIYNQFGISNLEGWINDPKANFPDRYFIGKNTSNSTISYATIKLPPNLLTMDPESGTVITRWTAPSAGSWSITGLFQGIDTNEGYADVEIVEDNSTVLLTQTLLNSYGTQVSFKSTVSLNAGDTIDFVVEGTSQGGDLSTGLSAAISPAASGVPEPASLTLLGMGGVCFGGLGWLRRRKLAVAA